jgi:hypothetical protein
MERLGVSRTLLQMALTVLRQGVTELVEMVNRGEVAVSAAVLIAGLKRSEQKRLVANGAKAIKLRASAIRSDSEKHRDRSTSSTGRDASEGDRTSAADQQPLQDSAVGGTDEDARTQPDDADQASAQTESQPSARADEAKEPADAHENLDTQSESTPEGTTQVENSPGSGRAVESALTTPKSDPCDQDTRQATGKDLGSDLTVVAKPGTADPSPSPAEILIEGIPLRAQLGDPAIFDLNARLWRQVRPVLEDLRRRFLETPEVRHILDQTPRAANLLVHRLDRLVKTPPPEEWVVCWKCGGKGRTDAAPICGTCGGACHLCD